MEKKLHLSNKNKLIAGVCGGIGEYFLIDATIVRIIWTILTVISTGGFIAPLILYIICWALIPLQE